MTIVVMVSECYAISALANWLFNIQCVVVVHEWSPLERGSSILDDQHLENQTL